MCLNTQWKHLGSQIAFQRVGWTQSLLFQTRFYGWLVAFNEMFWIRNDGTKTDIYSVLIIAFLSTVFFNLHNNPERQTLLSLFGRWGDRFRETQYSSKTMWLTLVTEPLFEHRPVWLLGRAQKLVPEASSKSCCLHWFQEHHPRTMKHLMYSGPCKD